MDPSPFQLEPSDRVQHELRTPGSNLTRTTVPTPARLECLVTRSWTLESDYQAGPASDWERDSPVCRALLPRSHPALRLVLPDASIWIVVSLGSDVGTRGRGQAAAPTPTSFVIGPQTAPLMMEFGPTVRLAIVAFDASICESVLRIRATEIANRVTALDRYWPGALPQLLADCAPKGPVEVVRGIHRLLPTCTGLPPAADRLCAAGSFIRQRKGNVSVYHLATTIGVTRQYLSRLFHAHLGWSAKAHIRLARFNALSTAVLEGKTTRWRDLATELGLADQAHLIREFRRFAGKPPKRFLREGFE